ncbi:copper chaperone PCu(A)C [Altererythrobacter aquiaggeris]|uniref:copper chaperone PCu(A)C n=1 Tax=Aestuarierythrobacter aquiaggeris TaxID=1898396 RepID=UPI003018EBAA
MKTTLLTATALAFATLGLAACGETATETPGAQVEGIPGVSVENARLVLPAVAGNPGVVYFDIKNDGERGVAIRNVDVAAAQSAQLHEMAEWELKMQMMPMDQKMVEPGQTVSFEPGAYHVMANGIAEGTAAGGTTEVTLTFLGGDKISFPADVRAAGEDR